MTSLRLPLVFGALALAACAKDPTAGKTKADVAEARAESAPAPTAGETIAVTPANSSIGFIGAKVTAQHVGKFTDFAGTVTLVEQDPLKSRVELEVNTTALVVDGGLPKLENHLRSPDFFDVERFPSARFVSTEIARDGERYRVTGNLELHGVKKSVTFPASIQIGADAVTVDAEFGINRKDFGIEYPGAKDDLIKDNVLIQIAIKAPRSGRS